MTLLITGNEKLKEFRILHVKRNTQQTYEILGKTSSIVTKFSIDIDLDTPVIEMTLQVLLTEEVDLFQNGDYMVVYIPMAQHDGSVIVERKHLFHILEMNYNPNTNLINIVTRNFGHWLERDSFFLKIHARETASAFIERTCLQFGIPIDSIIQTQHLLAGRIFQHTSLYKAWLNALSTTMIKDSKNYMIDVTPDGIRIREIVTSLNLWLFEVNENFPNIMNLRRKESLIEGKFVNVARGINPPNQSGNFLSDLVKINSSLFIEENEESIAQYGVWTEDYDVSQFGDASEAQDHLRNVVVNAKPFDEVRFRTFGINNIIPPEAIYVYEPRINALGHYFVRHVTISGSGEEYYNDITAVKHKEIPTNIIRDIQQSSGNILTRLVNNIGG